MKNYLGDALCMDRIHLGPHLLKAMVMLNYTIWIYTDTILETCNFHSPQNQLASCNLGS